MISYYIFNRYDIHNVVNIYEKIAIYYLLMVKLTEKYTSTYTKGVQSPDPHYFPVILKKSLYHNSVFLTPLNVYASNFQNLALI